MIEENMVPKEQQKCQQTPKKPKSQRNANFETNANMIRKNLLVLNYQTEKLHNQEKHKKTRTP
jgi:hypothetical protein